MQLIMNGYSEIFNVAERTARKYFRYYEKFLLPFQDINDIIQESHLTVFETITRYKDKEKEEIFKLCNQAVGWKLKKIVGYARNHQTLLEDDLNLTEEEIYDTDTVLSLLSNGTKEKKFNVEELIAVLSEREYEILKSMVFERRTNREIAESQNCSKQMINSIYHRALNKIRKYLEITKNE